jgi:hypothetical protein
LAVLRLITSSNFVGCSIGWKVTSLCAFYNLVNEDRGTPVELLSGPYDMRPPSCDQMACAHMVGSRFLLAISRSRVRWNNVKAPGQPRTKNAGLQPFASPPSSKTSAGNSCLTKSLCLGRCSLLSIAPSCPGIKLNHLLHRYLRRKRHSSRATPW